MVFVVVVLQVGVVAPVHQAVLAAAALGRTDVPARAPVVHRRDPVGAHQRGLAAPAARSHVGAQSQSHQSLVPDQNRSNFLLLQFINQTIRPYVIASPISTHNFFQVTNLFR